MFVLKIIFIPFFLCFCLIKNTLAQSADEGGSLGVKGGVNISGYNVQDATVRIAPGFNIGIFSRAALSQYFGIQPEFNLNVQNSEITSSDNLKNFHFTMLMSYVEFTFSGVLILNKAYFQLGPFVSYLANTMINDKSSGNLVLSEIISRKNFYDIDYGLAYTAGLRLKRWDIGMRYNEGLYKIGKEDTPNGDLNIYRKSKTSSLQLYAGYYF